MRLTVITICLFCAALLFNGCSPKTETIYVYKKYPKPHIEAPQIQLKCEEVKCVLFNYQRMKDYAYNLKDALEEVTE